MTWRPDHVSRTYGANRPEVGDVVAYSRRAWEVTHVAVDDPTPEEQDRFNSYGAAWRDRIRPYRVTLRRIHGERHDGENSRKEIGLRVPVGSHDPLPAYPHGRVPLCSCHGHPWPCLEADQQAQAEREMARAEHEMKLLPGCCPACQEVVTQRQRSISFPGPYVRNPLAASDPVFHLRGKCWREAARYEEEWIAAYPTTARRSLLTLKCEGTVIVHEDGSGECFGAVDSDCPSIYAQHRRMSACYIQSHGCGKGCTSRRHGTRLYGHPVDPRGIASGKAGG